MNKRFAAFAVLALAFFIAAAIFLQRPPKVEKRQEDPAIARPQLTKEEIADLRKTLLDLPPEEQERREMAFIAEHGKDALIGARDWDGRTGGLFPEEHPETAAGKREIPKMALERGSDDTAPDGTTRLVPLESTPGEALPETTSSVPAVVKSDAKKPADPKEEDPAPDGRRKRAPSQLIGK